MKDNNNINWTGEKNATKISSPTMMNIIRNIRKKEEAEIANTRKKREREKILRPTNKNNNKTNASPIHEKNGNICRKFVIVESL